MRRLALLAPFAFIVLALLLSAPSPALAVDECSDFTSPGNPYACCSWGNCTWWAYYRRPDIGEWCRDAGNSNNAKYWLGNAKAVGLATGSYPIPASIACFNNLSANGHVAHVEEVYPDGSFKASEMNCDISTAKGMRTKTYPAGSASGFIYGKQISLTISQASSVIDACRTRLAATASGSTSRTTHTGRWL